jgi:hypothetical protein
MKRRDFILKTGTVAAGILLLNTFEKSNQLLASPNIKISKERITKKQIQTTMLSSTAQKALDTYGGAELWKNSKYIEAEVSAKGLAFKLKHRPFFERAKIIMEIGRPFSKLKPIGKNENICGVLDGLDVRLEKPDGTIIAERKNARNYFPFGKRLFKWDDMDMAYFANYAFWNYFTFANLLMNENILWLEKEPGILVATFPDSIPTHCKTQEFHIDMNTGKLIQHNYTVDIISKLAKVANVIIQHKEENGICYTSERRVTPRNSKGKPLKKPIMIDINVYSFKLTNDAIINNKL